MWAIENYPSKEIIFVWDKNKSCNVEFLDVFKRVSHKEHIYYMNWEEIISVSGKVDETCDFCEFIREKKFNLTDWAKIYIDGDFLMTAVDLKESFGQENIKREQKTWKYNSQIRIREGIKEKARDVAKKYNIDKRVIGIHIRGMESHLYRRDVNKLEQLISRYKHQMGEILRANHDQRFFIASDDKQIEDDFIGSFPENVFNCPELSHPDHTIGKGPVRDKRETLDALITVLLLSRTDYNNILRLNGHYSTFTRIPYYHQGHIWPKEKKWNI